MTREPSEHSVIIHHAPGVRAWLEAAGFHGSVREIDAAESPEETPGTVFVRGAGTAGEAASAGEAVSAGEAGSAGGERRAEENDDYGWGGGAERVVEWQPRTFKQVLARALALGAAAGCQAGMMKVIAEGEARLAAMRERLGIDRKAPPEDLAPCVVFVGDRPVWDVWIPDLIDRAAGRGAGDHSAADHSAGDHSAGDHSAGHHSGADRAIEHEIPDRVNIVRFGPDILVPGPHLYDAVLRIARELYPNRT